MARNKREAGDGRFFSHGIGGFRILKEVIKDAFILNISHGSRSYHCRMGATRGCWLE